MSGHGGNQQEPNQPKGGTGANQPLGEQTEPTTEEFLALLPKELADKLDPDANKPIYPPPLEIGLADFDKTNPVVWGSDWRFLAPPDSDAYKDAIKNPTDVTTEDNYQQVLDTVVKSILQSD